MGQVLGQTFDRFWKKYFRLWYSRIVEGGTMDYGTNKFTGMTNCKGNYNINTKDYYCLEAATVKSETVNLQLHAPYHRESSGRACVSTNIPIPKEARKEMSPTLTASQIKCPLPNDAIVSGSCDHNGGVITNKDGIKLTIPKGAIKDGDTVMFYIVVGLFGPFKLPLNCQTDLASPYYWIGVTGSYHFQRPVQVEFEHYGACDPSHYQLLTCEDDDESHTMQPVDYELTFKVRDDMLLCSYQTSQFCSCCLYHNYKDLNMHRIG